MKSFPAINAGNRCNAFEIPLLKALRHLKFKFKPLKKPHSHIRYDAELLACEVINAFFLVVRDRIKQISTYQSFSRNDMVLEVSSSYYWLRKRFKKCFKANLNLFNHQIFNKLIDRVVGIDSGLYNIVSLSDGFLYACNGIRKFKRKVLFLKKQLQEKGTRSAKRKLKALSGYEKRFILNENHKIAKQLVEMPFDIYVLEDLSGIRKQKSKGKKLNKWLSNWSFWQLEQLLTYKAEAVGKQVVKVDARYTSQKCSNCGKIEKSNRNGSHYACSCGYRDHSDTNASKNIRNNYLISVVERKTEQAMCQLAECIDSIERVSDTSPCL